MAQMDPNRILKLLRKALAECEECLPEDGWHLRVSAIFSPPRGGRIAVSVSNDEEDAPEIG